MKYKTRTKNLYFARYFSFEENPSKGIKLNMVEVTYKKSTAVFSSRNFPLKDKLSQKLVGNNCRILLVERLSV